LKLFLKGGEEGYERVIRGGELIKVHGDVTMKPLVQLMYANKMWKYLN
jgi:hypothetical protein